jgi:glycosyltransferase involved in cell wall biosynthesis
MEIDVILPFHLENKLLYESIDSVLSSSKVELNLLLLDNRCAENFMTPLKRKLSENTTLIPSRKSGTYADALNASKKHLRSKYFALMNSDDLIASERLFKQVRKVELEGTDICITKFRKINSKKREIPSILKCPSYEDYTWKYLLIGAYGADATLLGKSSWLRNKNFRNLPNADWIFALENYPQSRISIVNEELYFYRMHKKQITRSKVYKSKNEKFLELATEAYQKEGIKKISTSMVSAIMQPYTFPKVSTSNFLEIQKTMIQLSNLFKPGSQRDTAQDLLIRRISLLILANPLLFKKITIYSKSRIIHELKMIALEVLRGRHYLRIKFWQR